MVGGVPGDGPGNRQDADCHEQVSPCPVHSECYRDVLGVGPEECPDKLGGQLHPERRHHPDPGGHVGGAGQGVACGRYPRDGLGYLHPLKDAGDLRTYDLVWIRMLVETAPATETGEYERKRPETRSMAATRLAPASVRTVSMGVPG